jgi:cystathionine gamma-lyase
MRFDTLAIHHAQEPDPTTGSVATPICQTSTFAQRAPGVHQGFDYSRTNNPTRQTLERVLASLEGVAHAAVFASGLAAEHAILSAHTRPGDHVITAEDVYGGTYRLLDKVHRPHGCEFTQADLGDPAALERAFRPSTKLVWLESPTNPRLLVCDLAAVCEIAHRHGALVVADNTFASPVNQRPFDLGADLVIHSVTKYLSGHSDVIQGAVLARDEAVFAPVKFLQNATGAVPSPFDCWLTLRGLKTLSLRVARHNENAQRVAEALAGHPAVARVHYPGLPSHPGHEIAKRQMTGFGGVVSLELDASVDATTRFVSSRRYFKLGESLGGVKSLVCHPASMTHASIPAAERRARGLSDSLIRLSVGIEDARDLIEDLAEGLDAL